LKNLIVSTTVRILNYVLIIFNIGVPTSNINSSQQWDYPNCWSPLQAMVIQGLDRTNYKPAQTVAINLAKSWINTNYVGYITSGTMFEKVINVFHHSVDSTM